MMLRPGCILCSRDIVRYRNPSTLGLVFVSSQQLINVPRIVLMQLGLGAKQGITTYFSANCEEADADLAGRFLNSIQLSPYNTRLFKEQPVDGAPTRYVVLVASAATGPIPQENFPFQSQYVFEDAVFEIRLGDHSSAMRKTVESLRQAAGSHECVLPWK